MAEPAPARLGLYVHWPFCLAKCPYCDFNSHVAAEIDESRWIRAYLSEIARLRDALPGRLLVSIFFGGGTPSLMSAGTVGAIIDAARRAWPAANDLEITLEANPTSVEAGRFGEFRAAGVTRVSVGLQSLRDDALRRLGRQHDVREGLRALDIARHSFDRVSLDLIYARQHQGLDDWRAELAEALALGTDHLSLYQLTIEPGTRLGARHARGGLGGLPGHDLGADMFEHTQSACEAAGLPAYEISNHARPGHECRHNLIYWQGGEYAGIGPGAHGRLDIAGRRTATVAEPAPGDWLTRVETLGTGDAETAALGPDDRIAEALMMGLRLRRGIKAEGLRALGADKALFNKINNLEKSGLLHLAAGRIAATDRGRQLLNAVLRELLP